jgi:HlyD family secretion protein
MDRKLEKKSWIRRHLFYVIGGTIILSAILYLVIFSDHSSKLNVETDKVTIEEAKKDIFQDYIAVIGTVEPIKTVFIDATEGGRVEEKMIEEGAIVKKGDVILMLSNDNLLLEISNNEAQVAQAENEVKTLRVNLENQQISNKTQLIDLYYDILKLEREYKYNQELFRKGLISKEDLDVSRENYEKNKAHYELYTVKSQKDSLFMKSRLAASETSVESMQSNLNIIRGRLNKLTVKAPVSGELASLKPEVGEVIAYGTRIGIINIIDSYKLRVEIDEHYLARIKRGLKGACDFTDKDYPATLTKIFPEVKEGKFFVDMEFDKNVPQEIRIGQTSRIRLELGESQHAILVSRGGFYQNTGGQWIYVLDKTGTFAEKRSIRIGRQNPTYYEVLEGLEPGEKVIISGYDNFGNVDKLMLK